VGPTHQPEIEPRSFYSPEQVVPAVTQQVQAAQQNGQAIDYLTFVPDGEPTLDINLASIIEQLRPLGIRIAVISNASLLWRQDVRDRLQQADWVSLKVDSVIVDSWQQINQPHPDLSLPDILQGIQRFAKQYHGLLTTETMLVAGINDKSNELEPLATFLSSVQPDISYLAIPIRPPAQAEVQIPNEQHIVQAYDIFSSRLNDVEYLIGYEDVDFVSSDDPRQDLLAITAVHPMRKEAVQHLLDKAGLDWGFIETLLRQGDLVEVAYLGQRFYTRRPRINT
jgi:wyosine [tRNA(Phe)-imidazoG37] synthetase (radical SAM superfamily)